MNKLNKTLLALALLVFMAPVPISLAEDIDIYAKPETEDGSGNPNVLIIVDNSANWADNAQHFPGMMQGEAELSAVRTVASELNDKVNLGLMMFTEGSGTNKDGGYVRFKVRKMDQYNKSAFSELIGLTSGCNDGANSLNGTPNCIYKNFNKPAEKSGTAKTNYSAAMFEVFKYFGGYTSPAHAEDGVAGTPLDSSHFGPLRYAGDPDAKSDRYAFQSAVGDTTPSADANLTEYVTPIGSASNCANNYVIFIGNGFPNQDSPASLLSGVGGDTGQLLLNDLAVTSTPLETLAATTSCGAFDSVVACASTLNETDPALVSEGIKAAYPLMARDGTGYDSYRCEVASACPAGTVTDSLGTSACGAYVSQAVCEADVPAGYDSVSCTAPASCTASIANPDSPVAYTACIGSNLSNATNCNDYGAANYSNYSGFSCSVDTNCGGGSGKSWRIDATTKQVSALTYSRSGTKTTTLASSSFNIYGTANVTAATPTGTFSAPASVRYADEWARFLNKTDVSAATGPQNVTTFTIDVYKDKQDQDQTKLLMSMARAGGGKYFNASNEQAIVTALRKIMSEIQSVNSVFASSSLPVSVNTQGTYLNQVFMGMFRPEGSAAPRWAGNLKQYEFKIFNGVLRLADKHGNEAISSTTGFVTPCAASFWSTDTGDYWNFPGSQANGDCTALTSSFPSAGSSSIFSDWPDGEVVEKGGAAQHLRGTKSTCTTDGNGVTTCTDLVASSQNYNVCGTGETPLNAQCRKLLTCDGTSAASCTSLTSFDTSTATVTSALSTSLIEWVRGKDVDNENGNIDAGGNAIVDEVRPSVHGGVVHSQPAVVDYGGSTGVIAFYGADDGALHAVKGNQEDTDGAELWGFIAPETYGRFARLRDNGVTTPLISFPADPVDARPTGTDRKDYFFDGSIGIYQKPDATSATGQKVWIYAGMRRGGRAVYGFDVSDPANPSLKWRRGCFTNDTTNDTSCSTDWAGIGQTWSKPTIGYLAGYVDGSGNPKPVVIFGGGYDTCEDNDSQTPCSTPSTSRKGAQVWFVDADTGAIIRTYPISASTPGDISLLANSSGYATHIYVSDINGDIYRINAGTFNGTTLTASSSDSDFVAAGWSSNTNYEAIEIAQLSETNHARKFINGPNVVPYAGYNAVLIGSGDREHPLVGSYACNNFAQSSGGAAGTYVKNQFYMIKDSPNAYPVSPVTPGDLTDVTAGVTSVEMTDAETGLTVPAGTKFTEGLISPNGWRFDLGACEQAVNKPLTVAGTTYFGTNTPTPSTGSSCFANLGIAKGYAVDFATGNPIGNVRSAQYVGGGLPPSPVAGVVEVDGEKLPFIIGGIDVDDANPSALQGSKVEINPTGERFRVFWYIQND